MSFPIKILLTLDIHCYPHTEKELPQWLDLTLGLLGDLGVRATFFFPAVIAEKFSGYVRHISEKGHEIACHGLTHGPKEQYNEMDFEKQKLVLQEAKNRIEEVAGKEVIAFRSPAYKINGNTIKALEETGYRFDSSVNPQRLGILSSDITNIGWLYSPRKPYHPSFKNPFLPNNSGCSLWEIPQSAFIFPFMSNTGIAFGGKFMKMFYQILSLESALMGNPIVYMFHPEDIYPERRRYKYNFKWRDLIPSKLKGLPARKILFHNKNPHIIAQETTGLLKEMRDSKNARFLTFRNMLDLLSERKS